MRVTDRVNTDSVDGEATGEARRSRRATIHVDATLRRREGKTALVDILDLSATGFRAETTGTFKPGTQVWLRLPGLEAILARIIWTENMRIGCAFDQPLHPAVVDRFAHD